MKKLIIVRHAKSNWDAGILNDYDRVLNMQGHEEAKTMAAALKEIDVVPQHIISSTATRAITTANYFANVFDIPISDIEKNSNLYNAPATNYVDAVVHANDVFDCIAIFGHNPGISYFIDSLTTHKVNDMPTCGVFVIKIDCKSWGRFAKSKKTFLHYLHP